MFAIVRLKDEKDFRFLEMDYKTKKGFKSDLKANGYIVRSIYTNKQWENLEQVLQDREDRKLRRLIERE